jgi:hypothetical protein
MTRKRKPTPPDFEKFRTLILDTAADLGKTFTKPDDDWGPALFLWTAKGLSVSDLAGLFYNNDTKDRAAPALATLFRRTKPTLAALVSGAWQHRIEADGPLAGLAVDMALALGVADHPDREEVLMLQAASAAGDDELWVAPIHRSADRPPTLGDWQRCRDPGTGRLAGALGRAFRAAGLANRN